MKRKITWFGLLTLLMGLVIWLPGAVANDGFGNAAVNLGFGKKIAGTYFSNAGFGGTLTLHSDGTVVALSGACCGDNPGNIQSEAYGNWVRTGEYQIELRTVAIGTNHDFSNEIPELQGPVGNFIATPMEVLDFAEDFQSVTGTLCTSVWLYGLGPGTMPDVEVDAPLVTVGPFPVAMSRLAVFVECP
ncbi:MAG: hypothetical protein ACYSU7_11325 [Planctomycetota bacterium]|jgi:hypothetical protein